MGAGLRIVGALCIFAALGVFLTQWQAKAFAPLLITGCVLILVGRFVSRRQGAGRNS